MINIIQNGDPKLYRKPILVGTTKCRCGCIFTYCVNDMYEVPHVGEGDNGVNLKVDCPWCFFGVKVGETEE